MSGKETRLFFAVAEFARSGKTRVSLSQILQIWRALFRISVSTMDGKICQLMCLCAKKHPVWFSAGNPMNSYQFLANMLNLLIILIFMLFFW